MSSTEYQTKWGSVSDADSIVSMVALRSIPSSPVAVEQALAGVNILTMASGDLPSEFKIFLYAQDQRSGAVLLLQANISKSGEPMMILTIKISGGNKSSDQTMVDELTKIIQGALA